MTRCGASYTVKCYTEPEGLRSLVPYGHWVRGSRGSKPEESEVLRVPAAFAPSVLITNGSKDRRGPEVLGNGLKTEEALVPKAKASRAIRAGRKG
jgi:hypothetical protein